MTIYASDDRPGALELLLDAIRAAAPGAEVRGFHSGRELLDCAAERPCEVAFLDIDMPGMDGIETARRLKLRLPLVNIVFATGYDEYKGDAMDLRASGYLLKPITPEKVRAELDDLRHPPAQPAKRVRLQCFGNFEAYVDGRPVSFYYSKSKELLAYLVDRETLCSNAEIMAVLWAKDVSGGYFRLLWKDLTDTFSALGCGDILIRKRNGCALRTDLVSCDYYDWKRALPGGLNAYRGEYMAQYSWAELTHGTLECQEQKDRLIAE